MGRPDRHTTTVDGAAGHADRHGEPWDDPTESYDAYDAANDAASAKYEATRCRQYIDPWDPSQRLRWKHAEGCPGGHGPTGPLTGWAAHIARTRGLTP